MICDSSTLNTDAGCSVTMIDVVPRHPTFVGDGLGLRQSTARIVDAASPWPYTWRHRTTLPHSGTQQTPRRRSRPVSPACFAHCCPPCLQDVIDAYSGANGSDSWRPSPEIGFGNATYALPFPPIPRATYGFNDEITSKRNHSLTITPIAQSKSFRRRRFDECFVAAGEHHAMGSVTVPFGWLMTMPLPT